MTYCKEFSALLDPYIDGELSPEETARVREHLHTCDGCRAYVQAALAIRDAFPEAEDTPVPDGFAAGVMAAIRADAAPRKRRRPRWAKTLLPLAACCAVVVLAVSGLPRPGGTAVTDHPESHAEIAAPAEAAVPNVDSVEEDTAATAYATQSDEDTADVPDSTVSEAIAPEADTVGARHTGPACSRLRFQKQHFAPGREFCRCAGDGPGHFRDPIPQPDADGGGGRKPAGQLYAHL